MKNQKIIISLFLIIFLISGCGKRHIPQPLSLESKTGVRDLEYDPTISHKVKLILKRVRITAGESQSLDSLGLATMAEAIEIMEIGSGAVKILTEELKREKEDWRIRFWLIDMLGYLNHEYAVEPLASIMLNSSEKRENRICAIGALGRIRHDHARGELRNALNILTEQDLRERVAEALLEWKENRNRGIPND